MSQLKDLIVLELASVLAGPGVGQFFAELGAKVIKVENAKTRGDVTRTWKLKDETTDDRSAYFCSVNWGKQSIAVDLNHADGKSIVHQLARQVHIVVASYKPGDAARLGVDYQALSSLNPGLIYGQISGYGSKNQRVGYDAIVQAEAGFMSMNGEPGGKSLKMPVALIDVLAGHHLKEGLLLALLEKQQTGRGKLVDVSLIQAAVSSLSNQATNYLVAGRTPGKEGSAHPNIAPYGDVFLTSDAKEILLAIGTDNQFDGLCDILNIDELISNPAFKDNVSRVSNRAALNDILQSAISRWDAAELMQALFDRRIPAGIIRAVNEALDDPDVQAIRISATEFQGVRTYVAQTDSPFSHLTPPPRFGEHTEAILREMLKISPTGIEKLRLDGVIN